MQPRTRYLGNYRRVSLLSTVYPMRFIRLICVPQVYLMGKGSPLFVAQQLREPAARRTRTASVVWDHYAKEIKTKIPTHKHHKF